MRQIIFPIRHYETRMSCGWIPTQLCRSADLEATNLVTTSTFVLGLAIDTRCKKCRIDDALQHDDE
jgi:hypothetical protein